LAGKSLSKEGAPLEPFYTIHFGYKQVAPPEQLTIAARLQRSPLFIELLFWMF